MNVCTFKRMNDEKRVAEAAVAVISKRIGAIMIVVVEVRVAEAAVAVLSK